jgi:hypothetical protein
MRIDAVLAAAFVLSAYAGQAPATTYDAFKQFSIKMNPNGPWSYVAAGQILPNSNTKCNGIKKDYCWTSNGAGFPDVAAAEANKTGKTISYADVSLPASYLDMDPEGVTSVAFQWQAKVAGTVSVTGNFLGVASDQGSHDVAILHNGTSLLSVTISSFQQKQAFKLKVAVAAGDTIAFTCFTGNGGGALSTGLQAKIVAK